MRSLLGHRLLVGVNSGVLGGVKPTERSTLDSSESNRLKSSKQVLPNNRQILVGRHMEVPLQQAREYGLKGMSRRQRHKPSGLPPMLLRPPNDLDDRFLLTGSLLWRLAPPWETISVG
jgi:hypothetical protein